jgi:hypothetical protein
MSFVAKTLVSLAEKWSSSKSRSKYTYSFSEGNSDDVEELGIIGTGLCTIQRLKFSCPPGFIIGTTAFRIFSNVSKKSPVLPIWLMDECKLKIDKIALDLGLSFDYDGDARPLLVSVRCGTTIVCPDVCHSILSVGMSDNVCKRLEIWSNNKWFSLNVYANFLHSFGVHVMNVSPAKYEAVVLQYSSNGIDEFNYPVDVLQKMIAQMKVIVVIPDDPYEQLNLVLFSMYSNWNSNWYVPFLARK